MKTIFIMLLIACMAKTGMAQYKPVEQGSTLKFNIKNLGFGVDGSFSGFEGNINFDPQNLATSTFTISLAAATVNTDNNLRDEHLKGEDYFDVKNYPRIKLVSTSVAVVKNGVYKFTGQLTIKDKSKLITFPFTATPVPDGFIFKGTFKINRKDFDLGGTSTIANELEVAINMKAQKVNFL